MRKERGDSVECTECREMNRKRWMPLDGWWFNKLKGTYNF